MGTVAPKLLSVNAAAIASGQSYQAVNRRFIGKVGRWATPGKSQALDNNIELELEKYVHLMADIGFGIDTIDLSAIALQIAKDLGGTDFKASNGWRSEFMRRHPTVTRRRADQYERKRAGGMNKQMVSHYFVHVLGVAFAIAEKMQGRPLQGRNKGNVDEIGFTRGDDGKYILTRKGTHRTHTLTGGRGVHTSGIVLVSYKPANLKLAWPRASIKMTFCRPNQLKPLLNCTPKHRDAFDVNFIRPRSFPAFYANVTVFMFDAP